MTAPSPPPAHSPSRTAWIDWLRGVAVLFMIEIHALDAWTRDAARVPDGPWWWASHLGGFAAPLFLFLAGLMVGVRPVGPRAAARRGVEVIGYGYLFRLVLIALEGFSNLHSLYKVDILQQIGFSLVIAAPLLGEARRTAWRTAAAILALCALMPSATALPPAPVWIRPATDFVTGQRPLSYFPAFPWAAYLLGGVAVGAALRDRTGSDLSRCMIALAVCGAALAYAAREWIHPWVVARLGYAGPNHGADGVARMLYRLGVCVACVPVAFAVTRVARWGWGPLVQMGRTSLFVYVVHVPIVYGPFLRPRLKHALSLPRATIAVAIVCAAMLAASVGWERLRAWRKARQKARRAAPAAG